MQQDDVHRPLRSPHSQIRHNLGKNIITAESWDESIQQYGFKTFFLLFFFLAKSVNVNN